MSCQSSLIQTVPLSSSPVKDTGLSHSFFLLRQKKPGKKRNTSSFLRKGIGISFDNSFRVKKASDTGSNPVRGIECQVGCPSLYRVFGRGKGRNMKQYLVNYERRLEREICFLDSKGISSKTKSLLLKFKDHNLMNGISLARVIRQLGSLRLLAIQSKKDLDALSREDIERFVLWMQAKKYALETVDTHKKIVKVFYRWLNAGEYPDCVKWLKATTQKSTKLPEEMLSEEEVKAMILATLNKRDKALIASLWESGARIGELGTLFIKHVVFDDFGCQIIVDGKTGMRRIRLVSSAPYLLEWINLHPRHNEPNAPLWINLESGAGKQTPLKRIKLNTYSKRFLKTKI